MQSNFNTLMHDLVFKESFANEHNRRPLESLLENLLELPKGSLHNKLTVAYESQIGKSNVNEKASRTDIVVDYDDVVMDLEAYTYLDDESIDKSTFYVMKLSASRLIRGMEYEDLKVIQYNFVDNVSVNIGPDIVNEFRLVHSKYPEINTGKYKINFTGVVDNSNKHPLINGKDIFSASFFSWDGGNSYRILSFLKLLGFPAEISLGNITDDMMNNVKDMPAYPDNDCVQLINDTVIIKLSN